MSDAWLINGIPGSGKTTVARILASRMNRAVHIEGDRLQEWIVSGAVWPGDKPVDEAERQIKLNIHNQCLLARSFSEAGFVPVLDYVVARKALLDQYKRELHDYEMHVVVLAPGPEVALQRDSERSEKTVAEQWLHLEARFKQELNGIGLWLDSSTLSAEETADYILANRAKASL